MTSAYEQAKKEYDTGRWSRAFKLFQEIVDDQTRGTEVRIMMARCMAQLGDADGAEVALEEAKTRLKDNDREMVQAFKAALNLIKETRKLDAREIAERRRLAESQ